MLFKTATFVLLSSLTVHADNTPNLCSPDILNLQRIAPSDTGLDISPIPGKLLSSLTSNVISNCVSYPTFVYFI